MSKIKIKTKIISNDQKITENVIGSIESGIISYQENNNTYVYLDVKRDELIRENIEMNMKYIFDKQKITKAKIFIKGLNQELELDIKTLKIDKNENKYKVEYIIEKDKFTYEIEYMEG